MFKDASSKVYKRSSLTLLAVGLWLLTQLTTNGECTKFPNNRHGAPLEAIEFILPMLIAAALLYLYGSLRGEGRVISRWLLPTFVLWNTTTTLGCGSCCGGDSSAFLPISSLSIFILGFLSIDYLRYLPHRLPKTLLTLGPALTLTGVGVRLIGTTAKAAARSIDPPLPGYDGTTNWIHFRQTQIIEQAPDYLNTLTSASLRIIIAGLCATALISSVARLIERRGTVVHFELRTLVEGTIQWIAVLGYFVWTPYLVEYLRWFHFPCDYN